MNSLTCIIVYNIFYLVEFFDFESLMSQIIQITCTQGRGGRRGGCFRARLFRRIERAKRPFIKSQKSEYVWLGEICGIAFLNQQIFAFQEKQFHIAISISRDLQIVISPIFFAENQK